LSRIQITPCTCARLTYCAVQLPSSSLSRSPDRHQPFPYKSKADLQQKSLATFTMLIAPLQYNSSCITFTEWVSLFTLCLAPLIAHIISGAPSISYLSHTRPKWYDHLCHYNPTSILWRYAAITDRRIRATNWSCNDLAASNAIFWTGHGWDGDESMVVLGAIHCIRSSTHTRVQFLSTTTAKTMITTLQGVAALSTLIGVMTDRIFPGWALDSIFFPFAILGLLRLCAATWLTEDFAYSPRSRAPMRHPFNNLKLAMDDTDVLLAELHESIDPFLTTTSELTDQYKSPNSSWPSRLFRVLFVLCVCGTWGISFVSFMQMAETRASVASFLMALFYLFFTSISAALYAVYFFFGKTTTTLIPCMSATWYRCYTVLLFGLMLALITIASIETNRAPNGSYTTGRFGFENHNCISFSSAHWYHISPNSTWIASKMGGAVNPQLQLGKNMSSIAVTAVTGSNFLPAESYVLYPFTGWFMVEGG
jgi:hypothetical protein